VSGNESGDLDTPQPAVPTIVIGDEIPGEPEPDSVDLAISHIVPKKRKKYMTQVWDCFCFTKLIKNVYVCWFKLIYLRSIAKEVVPTYINHSRSLIPDEIQLIFLTRFERREAKPIPKCWALSKEASGTSFITSLVWHAWGSNLWHPAQVANALTTEPLLWPLSTSNVSKSFGFMCCSKWL